MCRNSVSSRPPRRKRYVLLLAPDELDLAKRLAARECRSLPDFFRWHIYDSAVRLGMEIPIEEPEPKPRLPDDDFRGELDATQG